jgi:hypothetical protein
VTQGGLFCRTCGELLTRDDEQRQGECERCYELFAPQAAVPAPPPEYVPDDLALAWLAVERPPGPDPAATERAGVWIVVAALESFERTWSAIRKATEAGQLGPSARVVPARSYQLPRAWRGPQLVIEVTTYDATDEADVWRVRQAIRDLGVITALTYKATQRPGRVPTQPRMRNRSLFD